MAHDPEHASFCMQRRCRHRSPEFLPSSCPLLRIEVFFPWSAQKIDRSRPVFLALPQRTAPSPSPLLQRQLVRPEPKKTWRELRASASSRHTVSRPSLRLRGNPLRRPRVGAHGECMSIPGQRRLHALMFVAASAVDAACNTIQVANVTQCSLPPQPECSQAHGQYRHHLQPVRDYRAAAAEPGGTAARWIEERLPHALHPNAQTRPAPCKF